MAQTAKLKCQYQSARIHYLETVWFSPPPPPGFDYCGTAPVTGTLNGTVVTCQRSGTLVPFGDVFGAGDDGYFSIAFLDTFATRDGTITVHEYDLYDFQVPVAMMKVVGGTGKFAGATGTLVMVPALQNFDNATPYSADLAVTGVICPATP